jgi:MFS family permease
LTARTESRIQILILSSSAFAIGYFARLVWSIVSSYSNLGTNALSNGYIFALLFGGYVCVQIPSGMLTDKFGSKSVLSMSMFLLAFSAYLAGAAGSLQLEELASLAIGITAGFSYPAALKMVSSSYIRGEASVGIGYFTLAFPISVIVTGLSIPTITAALGWRWGFYVVTAASVLVGLGFLAIEHKDVGAVYRFDVRSILTRNTLLLSMGGLVFYSGAWIFTLYSYNYFVDSGWSAGLAGILFSALAIGGIPATLLSGRLSKKIGSGRMIVLSSVAYAALLLVFAAARSFLFLLVIILALGYFRFSMTSSGSTLTYLISGEKTGSVAGIANAFSQFGGVVGPLVAPLVLVAGSYGALWTAVSGLAIVSAVIYSNLKVKRQTGNKRSGKGSND